MNRSAPLILDALVVVEPVLLVLQSCTSNGQLAADAVIPGPPAPPGVTKRLVQDRGLYAPANSHNRPTVLVVVGSMGNLNGPASQAASLSSNGYVAFALATFAAEGLPPTLGHIPLAYFDVAIEWLRQHPSVDPDEISALGSSRAAWADSWSQVLSFLAESSEPDS